MSEHPTPAIWNGEKRQTGTEDWENDFDTRPYVESQRPQYVEAYRVARKPRPFNAYSITLQPGQATLILGQDTNREALYLNGVAANSIIIGEKSAVSLGLGYIVAGAEKLTTTEEIWATPVGGAAVVISYYVELCE